MNVPGLLLGFLVASACGFGFHLVRGGGLPRLLLYLSTSWVAFLSGHYVGEWLDWHFIRVGSLNLFPALLATFLGLLVAQILAGPVTKSKTKRSIRKNTHSRDR
jgi:hypothetical protein